jgi:hypothetical protein
MGAENRCVYFMVDFLPISQYLLSFMDKIIQLFFNLSFLFVRILIAKSLFLGLEGIIGLFYLVIDYIDFFL